MAATNLETTEPDPSATAIANDTTVNKDTVLEASNPTADAQSKIESDLPSTHEVDKAIAAVEAKKNQAGEAPKDVPVETNGHDVSDKNNAMEVETATKEPSERVKEGQKWNNRDRGGRGRGRGRARSGKDLENFRKNYKSDLTAQEESSDPVAIRKQVEFYFSHSNLLQDQFLFSKVQGHDNLPVPISTIHSFKRMRHFQPFSAVVDALKESTTLNVVGDDNDLVQRKTPLPEGLKDKPMFEVKKVHEDQAMKQSVYVKGFGEEQPSTQFDIEAFFAEYGPTNSVRLRRASNNMFKGSVFVEFDSEESQKKFLELDPKPKWKGQDLLIKSKKQYCDDKVEDIKSGKIRPRNAEEKRLAGNDDRDWKVRRAEDQQNGHKRGGGGRGFGSHKGGRGRGGRNSGGRRDRDEERRNDRDNRNVPKVATTAGSDNEDSKAAAPSKEPSAATTDNTQTEAGVPAPKSPPDSGAKKRAREDDDTLEDDRLAKKVDNRSIDGPTPMSVDTQ
ncbi:MAG: hypothetical protein LQ344_001128 [Seirophora lacunosa]|nr:MAG: hypothetical protein LQ344_001128 [Seirophora lacunosa]